MDFPIYRYENNEKQSQNKSKLNSRETDSNSVLQDSQPNTFSSEKNENFWHNLRKLWTKAPKEKHNEQTFNNEIKFEIESVIQEMNKIEKITEITQNKLLDLEKEVSNYQPDNNMSITNVDAKTLQKLAKRSEKQVLESNQLIEYFESFKSHINSNQFDLITNIKSLQEDLKVSSNLTDMIPTYQETLENCLSNMSAEIIMKWNEILTSKATDIRNSKKKSKSKKVNKIKNEMSKKEIKKSKKVKFQKSPSKVLVSNVRRSDRINKTCNKVVSNYPLPHYNIRNNNNNISVSSADSCEYPSKNEFLQKSNCTKGYVFHAPMSLLSKKTISKRNVNKEPQKVNKTKTTTTTTYHDKSSDSRSCRRSIEIFKYIEENLEKSSYNDSHTEIRPIKQRLQSSPTNDSEFDLISLKKLFE